MLRGLECEASQEKKLAFPRSPETKFGLSWNRARQKVAQFHHLVLTQPRGRPCPPGQLPLFTHWECLLGPS